MTLKMKRRSKNNLPGKELQEGNTIIECTLEAYIKEFRANLVDCLAEDQNM